MMIFLVGVDLGLDGTAIRRFREVGIRVFIFPLVTGVATVMTVLVCGLFTPLTVKELLGIACTFGWYSLGPNIMMDYGGGNRFFNKLSTYYIFIVYDSYSSKESWLHRGNRNASCCSNGFMYCDNRGFSK